VLHGHRGEQHEGGANLAALGDLMRGMRRDASTASGSDGVAGNRKRYSSDGLFPFCRVICLSADTSLL
jgi:hypothetical protein